MKKTARLAVAVCGLLPIAAGEASADPPVDDRAELMSRHMNRYFEGELDEAAVFLGVGTGAGFVGGGLLANGSEMAVGAAVPLIAVGTIQAGAGIVLLARTRAQARDLDRLIDRDLASYRAEELPRMEAVAFWFDVYKFIEIGLGVAGVAGMVWGAADERDAVLGAGAGLTAQSAAMLTLDVFAEARADEYIARIRQLTPAPAVSPDEGSFGLVWTGSF